MCEEKYHCFCCGYRTLECRAEFDICPVCYWEDEPYIIISDGSITSLYASDEPPTEEEILDEPSGANHGLTLRQARENYLAFGACEREMLQYVREPYETEKD